VALMGGMPTWGVRIMPRWSSYRTPRAHLYGSPETADPPWVRQRVICGVGNNLLYEQGQGIRYIEWISPLDLRHRVALRSNGRPIVPCYYCLRIARRTALVAE
jgi:hypothetical protein